MKQYILIILFFLSIKSLVFSNIIVNCNSEFEGTVKLHEIQADSSLILSGNNEIVLGNSSFQFNNDNFKTGAYRLNFYNKIKNRRTLSIPFFAGNSGNCEIYITIKDKNIEKENTKPKYIISELRFKNDLSEINNFMYSTTISDEYMWSYKEKWESEIDRFDSLRLVNMKMIESFEEKNDLTLVQRIILRYTCLVGVDFNLMLILYSESQDTASMRNAVNNYVEDNMIYSDNQKLTWYNFAFRRYIKLSFLLAHKENLTKNRYRIYTDSTVVEKFYKHIKLKCLNNPIIITNVVKRIRPFYKIDKYLYLLDITINDLKKNEPDTAYKYFENKKLKYVHLLPGKPLKYDITLSDTAGIQYKLSDFKDKIIYLDIWALWCGPCLKALPKLKKLQKKFKDNNDVVIININTDTRGKEKWKEYIRKNNIAGLSLHVNMENEKMMNINFKITGYPRYVLIDKGLLVKYQRAPAADKVADTILEMLK